MKHKRLNQKGIASIEGAIMMSAIITILMSSHARLDNNAENLFSTTNLNQTQQISVKSDYGKIKTDSQNKPNLFF